MNPSKLLFTVNVYVSGTDLKEHFQEAGLSHTHENHSRVKTELIYLLQKQMDQLLKEVTLNVKEWSQSS